MAVSGTTYNLRTFIIFKIVSGHLVTSLFQCRVSFSLRVRFRVSFRVSSTTRVRLLGYVIGIALFLSTLFSFYTFQCKTIVVIILYEILLGLALGLALDLRSL